MNNFTINVPFEFPPDLQKIEQTNLIVLCCSGLFVLLYLKSIVQNALFSVKAPVIGHRSIFEPEWLVRVRFVRGSREILREGYSKVSTAEACEYQSGD
jgi:hypothetical protein